MIAKSNYFYNNYFSLLYLSLVYERTPLRSLSDTEKNNLYLLLDDNDSGYRAKIILLKDEGYTVPEIRKMTNHHDIITYENGFIDSMMVAVLTVSLPKGTIINLKRL
jgi:hypothetical protein